MENGFLVDPLAADQGVYHRPTGRQGVSHHPPSSSRSGLDQQAECCGCTASGNTVFRPYWEGAEVVIDLSWASLL